MIVQACSMRTIILEKKIGWIHCSMILIGMDLEAYAEDNAAWYSIRVTRNKVGQGHWIISLPTKNEYVMVQITW